MARRILIITDAGPIGFTVNISAPACPRLPDRIEPSAPEIHGACSSVWTGKGGCRASGLNEDTVESNGMMHAAR